MSGAPPAVRESVAGEVRAVAARKRVTQASIARELGMSQQALSRRWTGELAFDVEELAAVARILDVSLGDLLPPTTPNGPASTSHTVAEVAFESPTPTQRRVRHLPRKSASVRLNAPLAA